MQKYTIAWEHSLRHAPLLVTRHAAIEAARHDYANDHHAFCVVFNTCYKWALIKNRLLEQLFHLAFYTLISEYSISYIYSHNSYFYTIVIPYSTKLWRISALNHIGGKNFGGLVDLHSTVKA